MAIIWDQVQRFTPQLYELYSTAPIWELDSSKFANDNGRNLYKSYWTQEIQGWKRQSEAKLGKWQKNGRLLATALEEYQELSSGGLFDFGQVLSSEPLPIAVAQIQERVALLSSNPPQPMAIAQQENQKEYVACLNALMDMVFSANDWEVQAADGHYSIQFWNCAIYKWAIDNFTPGIFGEPGLITLERPDADDIFFDPKCRKLNPKYMDYIIQRHEMEYADIQHQYPLAAGDVNEAADEMIAENSLSSRNGDDAIQSPVPKLGRDTVGLRQKITVLECWFRDSRLKFQPRIMSAKDKEYKDRYVTMQGKETFLDDDGCIIGDWVPRYPNGRLIVCTNSAILHDGPNDYPHGQFPYIFIPGMPATRPNTAGLASRVCTVTRKYNNIIADVHAYYQSEIKRPMHADAGAILDPNLSQQIPNDCSAVIELAPGRGLARRKAEDIPPLAFNYLSSLQGILDMVSGSSGVMRGNIADGAQMSAEALQALQQYASSQLALAAKFFNVGAKQLGYQLMWILRATVKSNIKVLVTLPTGEQTELDWKSDKAVFDRGNPTEIQRLRAEQDYLVGIRAGTGKPGAKDQQEARARSLYNDGAIDREALLDAIQYPDRQNIVARMKDEELQQIKAKAIGKELGVALSEQVKQTRPGRREKDK